MSIAIVKRELVKDPNMLAMEAVLYQEIKTILEETLYFRSREKGSLFMDFEQHGKYKGSGYTIKD